MLMKGIQCQTQMKALAQKTALIRKQMWCFFYGDKPLMMLACLLE